VLTLAAAALNADATTVRLLDAHGAAVPANVSGNGTDQLTLTPAGPLPPGAYTVRADGLATVGGEQLDGFAAPFVVGPAPDTAAPGVTFFLPPSGYRTTASTTVAWASDDAGATFECSIDNAPFAPCTSPVTRTYAPGAHTFGVIARDPAGNESAVATASWTYRKPPRGYWMVGATGTIYRFGTAPGLGSARTTGVVDVEVSPTGFGYWIADRGGHVFAFGDARWHGNASGLLAGETVTSLSRTRSGKGYWLFTSRGRVFARGDAKFRGDMRNVPLNGPVIDSVTTPSGNGYYMVASDGGVFTFGDARFRGSMGGKRINAPVRTLTPDPDGDGYWLAGRDGAVYAFAAPFRGSMGGKPLNKPVVGMVSFGNGYLIVGADGGIFNFSNRPFYGSLGADPPAIPIVAVAAYG
jgi:hypothetical protein